MKKNFLFFDKNWWLKIPILVIRIIKIGNSNDKPLAKSKNMVNFMYSEYLDSNSTGKELFKISSTNEIDDNSVLEDLLISFSNNQDLNQSKSFIF